MNKYEVLNMVGEGAYGVVLRCRNKTAGDIVAIKKFKESDEDESIRKTTLREVKILRLLRHNNIVSLIEAFRRKGKLYLVFEYVEKNLLQVLEAQPDGLENEIVKSYIYQLTNAIQWCHSHLIIHRDIKPENLLINTKTNQLKLCDFGFARVLEAAEGLTDYVATRWYRAPELLLGSTTYSFEVDIWAIGCIMGEITDGQPVFAGDSEVDQLYIIQKVLGPLTCEQMEAFELNPRFTGLKFPEMKRAETLQKKYVGKLSKRAMQLIILLLQLQPSLRPTAELVINHAYFESIVATNASQSITPKNMVNTRSNKVITNRDVEESTEEEQDKKDETSAAICNRSKSMERAIEREREMLREREIKALREFSTQLPINHHAPKGRQVDLSLSPAALILEQIDSSNLASNRRLTPPITVLNTHRNISVPPLERQSSNVAANKEFSENKSEAKSESKTKRTRPVPSALAMDTVPYWPAFDEDVHQSGFKTPIGTLESLLNAPIPLVSSTNDILKAEAKITTGRNSSKQNRAGGRSSVNSGAADDVKAGVARGSV